MEWLLDLGYLGLFLGTFLAGTVLPLSSDVLLIGMLACLLYTSDAADD